MKTEHTTHRYLLQRSIRFRLARARKQTPAEVLAGAQLPLNHPIAGLAEPTDVLAYEPINARKGVNT
jgi:hypothetical protein